MPLAAIVGERAALATSSYSAAVLKKHPVAYWRLGENHGPDAADASGNGHTGKYIGNPVFGERGAIGFIRRDPKFSTIQRADQRTRIKRGSLDSARRSRFCR